MTRSSPPSAAASMPTPPCRSVRLASSNRRSRRRGPHRGGAIPLAVVGAHLSGMALNRELAATSAIHRGDRDRGRLPPVRAGGNGAAEAGAAARRQRQRQRHRGRGLGDAARAVRPLRRAVPSPLSIGTVSARRRPHGEGIPGRGAGRERGARYFGLWRVAQLRQRMLALMARVPPLGGQVRGWHGPAADALSAPAAGRGPISRRRNGPSDPRPAPRRSEQGARG